MRETQSHVILYIYPFCYMSCKLFCLITIHVYKSVVWFKNGIFYLDALFILEF